MSHAALSRLAKMRILGKSPVSAYLRLNEWLWSHLPDRITGVWPARCYARFINRLVRLRADRRQYLGTFFFRNRPELELILRLLDAVEKGSTLRLVVFGCSNGAEVYSILYTIRSARPDLKVVTHAIDISAEVLELAKNGVYSLENPELVREKIFDRITADEMAAMFDREGGQVTIKPWLREDITWHVGDASDPAILQLIGPQDMAVANNFLCHMDPPDADRCLRNIVGSVPAGHLFVSGVDLDVRSRVARDLGLRPLSEGLEAIHDGDPVLCNSWPCNWWGLEPLDKGRPDWQIRYAAAFEVGGGH